MEIGRIKMAGLGFFSGLFFGWDCGMSPINNTDYVYLRPVLRCLLSS